MLLNQKLSPLKSKPFPRLELLGACLMVKLVENIYDIMQQEIKGQSIHKFNWVDSMAVFCWVKHPQPWAQYVRNRVNEILQKSSRKEWFYCLGPLNPTDFPSRGKYQNIDLNPLWWDGPGFLKADPSKWPKSPCNDELESQVAMNEKVKTEPVVARAMLMSEYKTLLCVENIVELQRFSNKDKLLRCIGWVLRFISNLKSAIKESAFNFNPTLSVFKVNKAECLLVKSIQKESFAKEIHYLSLTDSEKRGAKPPFTLTSSICI